ncbi:MAG: hypothetical protein U5K72_12955 [Balneolaceae bacterium]|nr:hypothetical protein [Balneolaceae bacterium]
MVQVIKRSESKESAKKKLKKRKKSDKKGFDADKYCGIIDWDIDPIEYQREARRERFESYH